MRSKATQFRGSLRKAGRGDSHRAWPQSPPKGESRSQGVLFTDPRPIPELPGVISEHVSWSQMSFGARSARSAWSEVAYDSPDSEAPTTGRSLAVARFSTTSLSQCRFNVVGEIFWQGTNSYKHSVLEGRGRGLHGVWSGTAQ